MGIVEFASYSDMQRAIDRLDDTELMGRRIKLVDDYNKSVGRNSVGGGGNVVGWNSVSTIFII